MTDAPIPGSRTLSEEEIDGLLHAIAEGFRSQLRAPVLHTPDEEGLDFEDVTFPSSDGVPLEGWFIPAPGGDRVASRPETSSANSSGDIDDGLMADLSRRLVLTTSIGLSRRAPVEWVRHVTVPTFLLQVHEDALTDPSDVQAMYAAVPDSRKRLHWVEGTTHRWDGYLEFQRRPEPVLDWLGTSLVAAADTVER